MPIELMNGNSKLNKLMMKINTFILTIIVFTLYSCSKTEDDTDNFCTTNCTTLQGRFVTANNVGISGVKILLKYKIPGGELGGGYQRMIVNTKTDVNGYFSKDFYIKDNELGNTAEGYFLIEYDDLSLNVNQYILSDNQIGNTTQPLREAIYSISTRDTIIGGTYYLPKKALIKVNLNNFIPIQANDFFEVRTYYPFGPDIGFNNTLNTPYSMGFSGYETFVANSLNTHLTPFVAEGEENIIRVYRRKNGISTSEEIQINIPPNNTIELNYDF